MRYIDAEKLKKLIEAEYKKYVGMSKQTYSALQYRYIADGLDIAEQLIDDALQQEQPEVDLEKEIQNKIYNIFFDLEGIAIIGTSAYAGVADMEFIARHFYELGRLNVKKEE